MNKNQITVTWHGHSCYTVSACGYSIVLDPYAPDSVPGLPPLSLSGDLVLCSHGHRDHGCREAVQICGGLKENPFEIQTIETYHDDQKGALHGENRIHVLSAFGIRIAHLGDLGCMLTENQAEELKNLDAVLIPVGGYYTIDASQAKELVRMISPKIVVPMHYRSDSFGYPEIGRLEAYTERCKDVVAYDTNILILDQNTEPQTAVLRLA